LSIKKSFLSFGLIISLLVNLVLLSKVVKVDESSSSSFDKNEVNFAFSNVVHDPKTLLLDAIHQAKDRLDVAIYNFDDKEIAEAILDANERGVNIRVITDGNKAEKDRRAAILDEFSQNHIEVKITTSQKMHLKMAIIDDYLIVTGSYNYTEASANENLEQLMTLANGELAKEWTSIFTTLWNKDEFKTWK